MDLEALLRHRAEHDLFLAEHYASPLPEEHQETFEGLEYYPPNPDWVIDGTFQPVDPRGVPIPSSAGTESNYTTVGSIAATIGESDYRLVVLDDGDGGRFIPFRDGTCGDTTYAGGRYVGVAPQAGGAAEVEVQVDFNRAGNPWCAYDEEFTCPLPPPENVITERIEAGEKSWNPTSAAGSE